MEWTSLLLPAGCALILGGFLLLDGPLRAGKFPADTALSLLAGVGVLVSIDSSGMGLYKSFAYEIFKRRPSVLLALDGNSAGVNLIQEARNGRYRARIFVSRHSRTLAAKADTLEGYVTLISGEEDAEKVLKAIREGGENA